MQSFAKIYRINILPVSFAGLSRRMKLEVESAWKLGFFVEGLKE
jgi:hypothetical protein